MQQVQLLGIQQSRHAAFTAVAGVGYFVNTTVEQYSNSTSRYLPGAVVAVKDYANTFDTNACNISSEMVQIKLVVN